MPPNIWKYKNYVNLKDTRLMCKKYVVFLYTKNELFKNLIKQPHLQLHQKELKYLWINLT